MAVSYKPLLHTLVEREMTLNDLRDESGARLNSSTVTRIRRNEYVSLQTIEIMCRELHCDVNEIITFVHNKGEDNK